MNHEIVCQWTETIANQFDCLNSWQIDNLGLFSYGVALAGSSRQNNIARQVACGEKIDSVTTRLKRFMRNVKWLTDIFFICLARWVLRHLPGRRIFLLVDETELTGRYGVMMMGVAFENRCLPLVWRSYKANNGKAYPREGQVEMIAGMPRLSLGEFQD